MGQMTVPVNILFNPKIDGKGGYKRQIFIKNEALILTNNEKEDKK